MTSRETVERAGSSKRRRRRVIIGVVVGAVAALLLGLVVVPFLVAVTWQKPEFESLAEHPDSSLHGTVAYFADQSACVRIVAAAGRPAKDVLCLKDQDVSEAMQKGKEIGPQLVWLPDGRLEVTMFRMSDPPGPTFRPGWQKVVDVGSGAVQDIPVADSPSETDLTSHPAVAPDGARISLESDNSEVVLTEGAVSRTLLSVDRPPDHSYGLLSAFWSPTWRWVAADDGRILIITTDDPAVTRVLTDESTSVAFGGDDERVARFAVTDLNFLIPAG